jgi:D-alanyl-D-alanine carboxypeptidase/D-alanyl-D-alanine-endopeptidase (penicillin-binding protein 4)
MLRHDQRRTAARVFLAILLTAIVLLPIVSVAATEPAKKKAPARKSLAVQIQDVLNQPQLTRAHWGIHAVDAETGKVLYSLNADQLFLPASNAKLFTTAAVLATAGPDYRFRTTVESAAKPDADGRLAGDLVLVGRGDPNLSSRVLPYELKTERTSSPIQVLEELVDQVARNGLRSVSGDLLADDTFYAAERLAPGWAQDDLQWIDGAPVSALTFNDNVDLLNIQPGAQAGDKAAISWSPDSAYYTIDNRIVTTAQGTPRKIGIHRDPGGKTITVWGTIPLGDRGMKEPMAVDDPAEFTAHLFLTLLQQRGITVAGKARARHADIAQFYDQAPPVAATAATPIPASTVTTTTALAASSTPSAAGNEASSSTPNASSPTSSQAQAVVLAEHVSLPLIEDVRVTNKTSQNLHAELALHLVGKLAGFSGSFEGGSAAVKQFLLQAGVKEEEFVLLDGSGLSRRDLVTPNAVVQLLLYALHQPWGTAYEGSLPIAAVDGSLSERFLNTPSAGLIHAKTGTLSHVNGLSGYGQTVQGRKFVFSIFCNNHSLGSAKILPVIDAVVQLLVTEGDGVK